MSKQISTSVDDLVHAAFLQKAAEAGITPYRLLSRLIHEHLGVVHTKATRVNEVYKALAEIQVGQVIQLNDVFSLRTLTFKPTEAEARSALEKAFLCQDAGGWKRIVKHV